MSGALGVDFASVCSYNRSVESQSKACSKCGNEKPTTEFYSCKRAGYRLLAACKSCVKEQVSNYRRAHSAVVKKKAKDYRLAHAPEIKARNEKYYVENAAAVKAATAAYRTSHREDVRRWSAAYRVAHREEIRQKKKDHYALNTSKLIADARAWRAKNPERYREISRAASKKWRRKHPELATMYSRASHASRRGDLDVRGSVLAALVPKLMSGQRGRCGCCRKKLLKYHVDHILPVSKGGDNSARNFQLLCAPCNIGKSNQDQIDFMRSRGFLL